jgi:hypothetical protein
MSDLSLTKINMKSGVWQGLVTGSDATPALLVTHLEKPVPGVTVLAAKEEGTWLLQIPIPPDAIADGIQTIVITDMASDTKLDSFALIAGEALGDDLRVEVDLLRAELDMLKRAFRRHCVETA